MVVSLTELRVVGFIGLRKKVIKNKFFLFGTFRIIRIFLSYIDPCGNWLIVMSLVRVMVPLQKNGVPGWGLIRRVGLVIE